MDGKATCYGALTATAFHRCNRDDLPHGFPAPCERLANRLQTMLTDFWPVRLEDRLGGPGRPLFSWVRPTLGLPARYHARSFSLRATRTSRANAFSDMVKSSSAAVKRIAAAGSCRP